MQSEELSVKQMGLLRRSTGSAIKESIEKKPEMAYTTRHASENT